MPRYPDPKQSIKFTIKKLQQTATPLTMLRIPQHGRPGRANPMSIPGSFSESDSDDHLSAAAHTPPISDEYLSPSSSMSLEVNTIGFRSLEQITEEANMCAASQLAFDHDDEAFAQLEVRLEELNAEYEQALEGQPSKDNIHDPAPDAFSNESEERNEQGPAGDVAQGHNEDDAVVQAIVGPYETAMKSSFDMAQKMVRAVPSAVSRFPATNNFRSTINCPYDVAEGMLSYTPLDYYRNYRHQVETQSLSNNDTAAPRSPEVKVAPSTARLDDQGEEQSLKKKWNTVKLKSGDDDGNSPIAKRPNLRSADENTFVPNTTPSSGSIRARVVSRASRPAPPELRTFEDVHRQIREQDKLTADNLAAQLELPLSSGPAAQQSEAVHSHPKRVHPKKNASSQSLLETHSGASTGQVCNVEYPIPNEGISRYPIPNEGISTIHLLDLLDNSDISDIEFDIEDDCVEVKNGDATTEATTLEPRQFVPTVAKYKKQACLYPDGLEYVIEEYGDSDAGPVPNVRKSDQSKKSSDVETASGFASADSTPAPDDAMVDEFLDFTANAFWRDEAFEILRMCGANLVAAVSIYRNARSLDHIRQMLRVWLAPLENGGFEAADRPVEQVNDVDFSELRICSIEKAPASVSGDEPTGARMSVRDAYKLLGLEVYSSVDQATLMKSVRPKLKQHGPASAMFQLETQLYQAFATVTQYQNEIDCCELSSSCMTVKECKDRFEVLRPPEGKASSTKEDKFKKQQDKAKDKTDAVRAAPSAISGDHGGSRDPWADLFGMPSSSCAWEYDHPAWLTNPDSPPGNWGSPEPDPQSSGDDAWASISNRDDPNNAPEPEAPASTDYTVTYWATVEAGDKTIHIPIDSSNVSGPEKEIIDGSIEMKKIWKWAQEKGLSDKIGLQDAFDLAKDMHCEGEVDQPVGEKPERATKAPRATSRSRSRSPCPRRAPPAADFLDVDYIYPSYVRPMVSPMSPGVEASVSYPMDSRMIVRAMALLYLSFSWIRDRTYGRDHGKGSSTYKAKGCL
ncbi:hypothetical protein BKA58DRAFT_396065 [Alternaria rosae]|uniref:uncharacterized protein n=1 Tax=Alternaria rosae TaxID=1187941 RepID=UPI001E8EA5AC|nr:uncharacterized protein BKA58DRAFT_396065 [Alternaria rosae]KAH6881686.1 hypothetical protein BKA58DRAFT_396065 [Alternaria rosae]